MFETIRAFFRLLKLYAGGEYVLVHRARYLAVRNLTAVGLTDLTERVATLEHAETIPTRPTPEEWARVKSLAEQAYDITVGIVPQSGIVATKAGVSGMPDAALEVLKK